MQLDSYLRKIIVYQKNNFVASCDWKTVHNARLYTIDYLRIICKYISFDYLDTILWHFNKILPITTNLDHSDNNIVRSVAK